MGEVKSQATTQIIDLQEDFLGVEKHRWMLANNKDIPVMTSRQVSGGFDYNKQRWLISTEGFYKTVDGITTNTQGFQNQNQGRSTSGSYTVKGIEFLINHRTEKFNSWISYTYSLNDYYFKELTPSIFPNNTDIRHSVSIASSYDINQFRIAIGLSHKTGKPYTIPVKGNEINNTTIPSSINYDLPNNENLPEYWRLDVSSSYRFFFSDQVKGNFSIALLNVLGKENTLNTYYELTNNQTEVRKVNNISLGFSPNASFRLTF